MSDGITALKELEWVHEDTDCIDRTQVKTYKTGKKINATDPDGNPIIDDSGNVIEIDEEKIIVQRSPMWTLVRRRKLVGVTKHNPQNGQTKKFFILMTGRQTKISYNSIGRIGSGKLFVCTSDKLTTINLKLSTASQRQVWLYVGPWENLQPSLFGGHKVIRMDGNQDEGDNES